MQSSLTDSIRRCRACAFSDPAYPPIPPQDISLPVPVMFIGESPSWAEDQDMPFAASTTSGQALENHYLAPLGLPRENVWITNLLKCRHPHEMYAHKAKYTADIRAAAEVCTQHWLLKELALVQPRVVVTLSDYLVYQRIRRLFDLALSPAFEDALGQAHSVTLGGREVLLFPMIHPDISRPEGDGDSRKLHSRRRWAPLHHAQHLPALKTVLAEVLQQA
jgi:uracil-DNA glycosylase family 4